MAPTGRRQNRIFAPFVQFSVVSKSCGHVLAGLGGHNLLRLIYRFGRNTKLLEISVSGQPGGNMHRRSAVFGLAVGLGLLGAAYGSTGSIASATTTATSLADLVTIARMASSTAMVPVCDAALGTHDPLRGTGGP